MSVFTRIIEGSLPGTFVWRDDACVAFMSINPLAPGHVLVVPIAEIDHWVDCPAGLSAHLFDVARTIGRAQRAAFDCERIGIIVAGFEVPHAHIHVVPARDIRDLSFANAAASVSGGDLDAWASAIRSRLPDGASPTIGEGG